MIQMVLFRCPGGCQWTLEGMGVRTVGVVNGGESLGSQIGGFGVCRRAANTLAVGVEDWARKFGWI